MNVQRVTYLPVPLRRKTRNFALYSCCAPMTFDWHVFTSDLTWTHHGRSLPSDPYIGSSDTRRALQLSVYWKTPYIMQDACSRRSASYICRHLPGYIPSFINQDKFDFPDTDSRLCIIHTQGWCSPPASQCFHLFFPCMFAVRKNEYSYPAGSCR